MRLIALLMLPSLAFAAPVPKKFEKPDVELTLSAQNQLELEITIHNNGKAPLELSYRFSPFDQIDVELLGEKGKKHTIRHHADNDEKETPGTLTILAGESKTLTIHTCHSLPELGEPGQKVTFTARLKYDGKTTVSEPLTVKP
jgi:hypothetical protein